MNLNPTRVVTSAVVLTALTLSTLGAVGAAAFSTELEIDTQPVSRTSGDRSSKIELLTFESQINVAAGTRVTWLNSDVAPHNVMSQDDSFKSAPVMVSGDAYSFTFAQPGFYSYLCTIHPFMTGVVVVE